MKTIVKVIFGSYLYGTATPESDRDYKGVFMPTREQIFLGKIPKSINTSTGSDNKRNTADDVDMEMYSLPYFIKLACEGQTVALDMLHAPRWAIIENSNLWSEIARRRSGFYTKNLKAFIGYARRQAAKYSVKGSRLKAAKEVIDILTPFSNETRMANIWDILPVGEHLHMLGENRNNLREYRVCGKIIQESAKVDYVLDMLNKFCYAFGKRARDAADNKNIDWKAVSHAMRAAYQTIEILERGTLSFPLLTAPLLRLIKQGGLDYVEMVSPMLEGLIKRVEVLSGESELPEKVDQKYWDNFVIEAMEGSLR